MTVVMFDPGNFIPYYLDALSRALATLGANVRVIASPPLFEPVASGAAYQVEHWFFPSFRGRRRALLRHRRRLRRSFKAISYPAGLARSWRALRDATPGVLHVHFSLAPTLDAAFVRALKRRGWRMVYTVHDPLPAPGRLLARPRLLALADALIVHSAHEATAIVEAHPFARPRLHVIPHGAVVVAPPSEEQRGAAREALGVAPDRPVLLFFGMIKPYKGLNHLLDALPTVLEKFPRTALIIAGEPLMSLAPLHEQIARLGLQDSVVLRPAFIPGHEVGRYLRAADMLVAPYVRGGASGVVVLAQGHGRPVVVTRVGALPDLVEPEACGFVVPPASSTALADTICRGLGDPEALSEMGERARRRLRLQNAWEDVARCTLDVYAAIGAR